MISRRCTTLFVIAILSSCWVQVDTQAVSNAGNKNAMDLLFMIDSSFFIKETNFRTLLKSVLKFVETLPVGPNEVNIAAISYSVVPRRTDFTGDIERLRTQIPNLFYEGLSALTHVAFDEAFTVLAARKILRPDARKVLLLITESMSLYQDESRKGAKKLLEAGVEVWTVGIGAYVKQPELVNFTGGNFSRAVLWDKFDVLPSINLGLEDKLPVVPTTTVPTNPESTSDLIVESSSVISFLSTRPSRTQALTPSQAPTEIQVTTTARSGATSTAATPSDRDLPLSSGQVPGNTNTDGSNAGLGDGSIVFNSSRYDGVCYQAVGLKGFGFASHQRDCSKFIQCYRSETGTITASVRTCPRGLYWDPSVLACVDPDLTCCSDPCKRKGEGQTFRMEGGCGLYWQCNNGVSRAVSCPQYYAYIPGTGCVFMPTCSYLDIHADDCSTFEKCDRMPLAGNTGYMVPTINGSQTFNCWDSMEFDLVSCSCRPMKSLIRKCPLVTYLNFTSNAMSNTTKNATDSPGVSNSTCKTSWNSVPVGNDNTVSTGNTSGITTCSSDSTRAVTLHFQYLSSANRSFGSSNEVLVRSSACMPSQDGILVVSEDIVSLNVRVLSPTGYAITASLPLWGLNQTLWRDVFIQYFGGNIFIEVTADNFVYNTYSKGGLHIPVGSCGWKVGIPEELNEFLSTFTGNITQVLVSRCNEYGF